MKRTLTMLATLAVLILSVSCEKKEPEKPQATITIKDNVSEIIFDVKDVAPKTLSFSSSDVWEITLENGSWLTVEPAQGPAGDQTVTISLKDGISEIERVDKVIIRAYETEKNVSIKQLATIPLKDIDIESIQRRVMPTGTIQMTAVNAANKEKLEGVTWSTDKPEFATIDEKGLLTAVAVGRAVVEAKCEGITDTLGIEITKDFFTDGLGKTYTLEDLSKLSTSGVIYENNVATIEKTLTIAAKDIITLGNATKLVLGDKMEFRVEGTMDFTAKNNVIIETREGAAKNAQIYFRGDDNGGGKISGIEFIAVYVRSFGAEPLTIENCKFSKITERRAAVNLGSTVLNTIKNCKFIENDYPAIAGGANIASPVIFSGNELQNNSKNARNRPQINLTVGGDGEVIVKDNIVVGPFANTPNGGISIGNMLGTPGTNKVTIEGNKVSGCRYGIALLGAMNIEINNNVLKDNKYDANPMSGGSGISITSPNDKTIVRMTGNTITGHLWGITNICGNAGTGAQLNLGNLTKGDNYNPGNNKFKDNGNSGKLYDLYNNSGAKVYAQGNYWNVAVQDEASIEEVIFHMKDDPKLGEVIFMPAGK